MMLGHTLAKAVPNCPQPGWELFLDASGQAPASIPEAPTAKHRFLFLRSTVLTLLACGYEQQRGKQCDKCRMVLLSCQQNIFCLHRLEVLSMQHPSSFGKHLKTTDRISLFLFLAP